jgi:hypothetical protein
LDVEVDAVHGEELAVALREAARLDEGSPGGQRTASVSSLPARNRGTRVAAIEIVAPLWGSRPLRAARRAASKVPKPVRVSLSPRRMTRVTSAWKALIARSAASLVIPASAAIRSMSSHLVIRCSGSGR